MKRRLLAVAVSLLALVTGCSLAGSRTEGPAPSSGALRRFGGQVTMGSSPLSSILEIRGQGTDVGAALRIPALDLSAQGSGRIHGDHVDLSLSYSGTCPGTIQVQGQMKEDGRRIVGKIIANDCTGREEGTLLLLLRPD